MLSSVSVTALSYCFTLESLSDVGYKYNQGKVSQHKCLYGLNLTIF